MSKSSSKYHFFNKTFLYGAVFLVVKTLLSESIVKFEPRGLRPSLTPSSGLSTLQGVLILCLEIIAVLFLAAVAARFAHIVKSDGATLLVILLLVDWVFIVAEVSVRPFFYYDFYDYALHAVSTILFFIAVLSLFRDFAKVVVTAVIFISLTISVPSLFSTVPSLFILSYMLSLRESDTAAKKKFHDIAAASSAAVVFGIASNYLFNKFIYSSISNGNKLQFLGLLKLYRLETAKVFVCVVPVAAFCLAAYFLSKKSDVKPSGCKAFTLVALSFAACLAGAFFCNFFWFFTTAGITPLLTLMISCSDGFAVNVGDSTLKSVGEIDKFFRQRPYLLVLFILLMFAFALPLI